MEKGNKSNLNHKTDNEYLESFINNDSLSVINYNISLYPETEYSINLVNAVSYNKVTFEKAIIEQFREKYENLKQLFNLRVSQFYTKTNNNYNKITINDYNQIPIVLYVELTSDNFWSKANINIKTSTHVFTSLVSLNIKRSINEYLFRIYVIKTALNLWIRAYNKVGNIMKLNEDLFQLHYLIMKSEIDWKGKSPYSTLNSRSFNFKLEVNLTLNSIEELAFIKLKKIISLVPLYSNKLSSIISMEDFDDLIYDTSSVKEYNAFKSIVRNRIFQQNKENNIYLYYANGKLQYKIEREDNQIQAEELNLVVWPKINKKIKSKDNMRFSALFSKQQKTSLSFRKTFQEKVPYDIRKSNKNDYVNENDLELNNYEDISYMDNSNENEKGSNFNLQKLYKTDEENENNTIETKHKRSDVHYKTVILSNKFTPQNNSYEILEIKSKDFNTQKTNDILSDIIDNSFISSIISNNSRIKIAKYDIDKYQPLQTKDFDFQIKINTSIIQKRERIRHRYYMKIFLSIVVFIVIIIVYFKYMNK